MKKGPLRSFVNATFFNGLADVILKGLITGPLLTAYVFSLGLGNIVLGFLQSLYSLSSIFHLPVSFLLEKGISPKRLACSFSFVGNLFLLFIALSFFIQDAELREIIFIGSYALFFLSFGLIGGAFWPWCKRVVPQKLLTSFFAHRIKYILLVKLITITSATLLISSFLKNSSNEAYWIYSGLIFVAFVIGSFYFYTLVSMSPAVLTSQTDTSFLKKLKYALKNKSFLALFLNLGLANFSFSFFTPFTMAFLLKGLGMSVSSGMIFSIGSSCVDIISINFWKKYSSKHNIPKMLSLSLIALIIAGSIFIYLGNNPKTTYCWLIFTMIMLGIGNSGFNLGITTSSLAYVPHQNASIYIALLNISRFGFTGLGTLIAGITLALLEKFTSNIYGLFFVICNILLFCSCIIIRKLRRITS